MLFLPISFSNPYFMFHREILNFVPEMYIILDVVILILNIIIHVCTAIAIQQPVYIDIDNSHIRLFRTHLGSRYPQRQGYQRLQEYDK